MFGLFCSRFNDHSGRLRLTLKGPSVAADVCGATTCAHIGPPSLFDKPHIMGSCCSPTAEAFMGNELGPALAVRRKLAACHRLNSSLGHERALFPKGLRESVWLHNPPNSLIHTHTHTHTHTSTLGWLWPSLGIKACQSVWVQGDLHGC